MKIEKLLPLTKASILKLLDIKENI